jgi:hypothetical protein
MRDPRVEGVLKSLGIRFTYEAESETSQFVSDPQTQVRLPANQAPVKEVKRYTDLLKNGAEFPPIVVLKDGRIVDGNTRFGAYSALKRKTVPAYWCESSSPSIAQRIGVELNSMAGKRMEKGELATWLAAGNGSVSEEEARRITGWSRASINRARSALQFEARRTKLGVPLATSLPETVRASLNSVANPETFRELTLLADDAGLKPGEVTALAKQANETAKTDVGAALAAISDARDTLAQAIQERAAGLKASTPLFMQLSLHGGWIIRQGASGLHDTNSFTAPKSLAVLEEVARIVHEAIQRYPES